MQMGCSRLRGTCNMGSDTISVFHNCDMQDIADKHPPQLPAMFNALAPLLPRSPVPLVPLPGLQSWSSSQLSPSCPRSSLQAWWTCPPPWGWACQCSPWTPSTAWWLSPYDHGYRHLCAVPILAWSRTSLSLSPPRWTITTTPWSMIMVTVKADKTNRKSET